MHQRQRIIPHDVLLEAALCGTAWILESCLKKADWACKTRVMTLFLPFPSPATHSQGLAQSGRYGAAASVKSVEQQVLSPTS